jgi:hypothetical protein
LLGTASLRISGGVTFALAIEVIRGRAPSAIEVLFLAVALLAILLGLVGALWGVLRDTPLRPAIVGTVLGRADALAILWLLSGVE